MGEADRRLAERRARKRETIAEVLRGAGFEDVYFLDRTAASRVLTTKRAELLDRVVLGGIDSVRGLSDDLDRDKAVVSRDLSVLDEHGLIVFEFEGTRKVPRPSHETVLLGPLW
jgi:predicted transcriptional regulator